MAVYIRSDDQNLSDRRHESVVAQPRLQNVPVGIVTGRVSQPLTKLAQIVGYLPPAEIVGDGLAVFPAVAEELCLVKVGELSVAVNT